MLFNGMLTIIQKTNVTKIMNVLQFELTANELRKDLKKVHREFLKNPSFDNLVRVTNARNRKNQHLYGTHKPIFDPIQTSNTNTQWQPKNRLKTPQIAKFGIFTEVTFGLIIHQLIYN